MRIVWIDDLCYGYYGFVDGFVHLIVPVIVMEVMGF